MRTDGSIAKDDSNHCDKAQKPPPSQTPCVNQPCPTEPPYSCDKYCKEFDEKCPKDFEQGSRNAHWLISMIASRNGADYFASCKRVCETYPFLGQAGSGNSLPCRDSYLNPTGRSAQANCMAGAYHGNGPFVVAQGEPQCGDSCSALCNLLMKSCAGGPGLESVSICMTQCAAQAARQVQSGSEGDDFGDTLWCRAYYGLSAVIGNVVDPTHQLCLSANWKSDVCTDNLCEQYCGLLADNCRGAVQSGGRGASIAAFDHLPPFWTRDLCEKSCKAFEIGDRSDTDRNTLQCRLNYARKAAQDGVGAQDRERQPRRIHFFLATFSRRMPTANAEGLDRAGGERRKGLGETRL